MANTSNREIWENGIPLNEAWVEFANPDAKRRYSERPTLETFSEQATYIQSGSDMLKLVSIGVRQWSDNGEFQRQLQALLLDELFNDQLHAYGYRIAPSRSRTPVRIAADLFECADVDWPRSSMTARGCFYSEIQISDPTCVVGWQKPRPGPKGSGDIIRTAIDTIRNRRADFCDIPRKSAFDLIRQEIGEKPIAGAGLSNQNLAKYVTAVCGTRRIKR